MGTGTVHFKTRVAISGSIHKMGITIVVLPSRVFVSTNLGNLTDIPKTCEPRVLCQGVCRSLTRERFSGDILICPSFFGGDSVMLLASSG